ncbi:hypothetical protein AU509_03905 [Lonsdalea britannica]|nr:hypothetical protein AU509_03905 [Lonsdalea britannica]
MKKTLMTAVLALAMSSSVYAAVGELLGDAGGAGAASAAVGSSTAAGVGVAAAAVAAATVATANDSSTSNSTGTSTSTVTSTRVNGIEIIIRPLRWPFFCFRGFRREPER